ncbi:protein of unknown function [Cupriavidus taiwanensis]|uniref:Uncharacterized protein n=1 Tax=Cupriavidus taiwanensis TaxID=164546 RepID=A0A375IAQ9_9BURK|nr:hypothetical protein CBM2608_A260038 [Cupriavidus taiwanensis]SPA27984.1 hypothetical protein CBM2623_A260038 [Cupriavidus taiwanensis]SPA45475.1 hypothetical protein CBM2629_A210065 [Cupriavidus taiwanensis]SPK71168.1 protein of unknown function [Cupriavidus taiwanensis]
MPRQRQVHSQALHQVPRPGQAEIAEDAGSEDPGRHRRRHAHPLVRQRRAGHQRRAPGRPVRGSPHQAARGVRARWRRPALPDADLVRHRGAGRRPGSADAERQGHLPGARGDPVRQDLPPARQGHQGRALGLPGRPLRACERGDAGQADRGTEGNAAPVRPLGARGRLAPQPAGNFLAGQGEKLLQLIRLAVWNRPRANVAGFVFGAAPGIIAGLLPSPACGRGAGGEGRRVHRHPACTAR